MDGATILMAAIAVVSFPKFTDRWAFYCREIPAINNVARLSNVPHLIRV